MKKIIISFLLVLLVVVGVVFLVISQKKSDVNPNLDNVSDVNTEKDEYSFDGYVYLKNNIPLVAYSKPSDYLFSYKIHAHEENGRIDIVNYIFNPQKTVLYIVLNVSNDNAFRVYQIKLHDKTHKELYTLNQPKAIYVQKEFDDKYLVLNKSSCSACEGGIESHIIVNIDTLATKEVPPATNFALNAETNSITYNKYDNVKKLCSEDDLRAELSPCFNEGGSIFKTVKVASPTTSSILLP